MTFKFCDKRRWAFHILIIGIMFLCAIFMGSVKVSASEDGTAAQNIYVENINVSGMNEEEINTVIQQKLDEYSASIITINVGDASIDVTAGELGLYLTESDIASKVLQVGNVGNVWRRYEISRKLADGEPAIFELKTAVSEDAVRSVVQQKCAALNIERRDMSLTMNADGTLSPTDMQNGVYVDEDKTVAAICEYMNNDWYGGYGEINAYTNIDQAAGDTAIYSQVNNLIGTGSTSFVTSDNLNRATNLAVATSRINGTVLRPGEEFSALAKMEPFEAETGYAPAPSIEMGEYVETYGGGACQVSTTLYRAVLQAELEVTERSAHSKMVGYVEPSLDAAVAEGVKDFKFVNNTDYPIYIEGIVSEDTITFNIYGHETRDPGRTLDFIGEIIKSSEIETVYELDPSLDIGYYEEVAGSQGTDAHAIKIVYQNGAEVSREEINYSTYDKQDHTITIGTNGASADQLLQLKEAVAAKDLTAVSSITGGLTLYSG